MSGRGGAKQRAYQIPWFQKISGLNYFRWLQSTHTEARHHDRPTPLLRNMSRSSRHILLSRILLWLVLEVCHRPLTCHHHPSTRITAVGYIHPRRNLNFRAPRITEIDLTGNRIPEEWLRQHHMVSKRREWMDSSLTYSSAHTTDSALRCKDGTRVISPSFTALTRVCMA